VPKFNFLLSYYSVPPWLVHLSVYRTIAYSILYDSLQYRRTQGVFTWICMIRLLSLHASAAMSAYVAYKKYRHQCNTALRGIKQYFCLCLFLFYDFTTLQLYNTYNIVLVFYRVCAIFILFANCLMLITY